MNRQTRIQQLLRDMLSLHHVSGMKGLGAVTTHSITPAQWRVLFLLDTKEAQSIKTVSEALHVTSSAATQIVDGLVRTAYVTRATDVHDRRSVLLTLSRKGRTVLIRMRTRVEANAQKLFSALSDADLEKYCMLTSKLVPKKTPSVLPK